MLPEKLSNKLCSLRPHEEKLTFSAVFELSPLAKVVSSWFGRTEIISDYRFDYEGAQAIIEAGPAAMDMELGQGSECGIVPAEVKEAVLTLNSLALKLRTKRFKAGAVNFDRPEMKVKVDENGKPVDVYQKFSKESNWLIEEFMLLANRSVAEFVAKTKKTFVYRIHDLPNMEKLGVEDVQLPVEGRHRPQARRPEDAHAARRRENGHGLRVGAAGVLPGQRQRGRRRKAGAQDPPDEGILAGGV